MENNIHEIGYLMKVITDKIRVKGDKDLKSQNLTLAQSRVLAYLLENGEKATQKEIEDFLEVAHPTVVGIITRMKENGYVETEIDPQNRRNKIVSLTEKAVAVGENLSINIAKQDSEMLEGLSEKQITELYNMLNIIYRNLKNNNA